MGVPWSITLYADSEETALTAQKAAFDRVKEIDRALSDYDPDSELNEVCAQAVAGKPVKISNDLFTVLQASRQLSCRTDGAFDVTVGLITDLWRRAYRKREMPPEEAIREALTKTGFQRIQLDSENRTVTFCKEGIQLDLGGIAKGYAAGEAIKVLKKQDVTSALVDASGDIVVSDPPPGKSGWIVGISPLRDADGEPETYLSLKNMAVATSGDASRYVLIENVRYSHIVNTETGIGLTEPSRVTVIAPNGMAADGLASALSVLGPDRGFQVLKKYQAEALMVQVKEAQPVISESEGFSKFVIEVEEE